MFFVFCVYRIYFFRYNAYSKNTAEETKKMYKIAVCDDEEKILEKTKRLIREWNPEVEVRGFSSGKELMENYEPYEAIFLDIDMPGMNGIETGKAIRRIDKGTKIVYLTAYRDYVAGAFGVHAFQYLLKPISEKKMGKVLEEIFSYRNIREKQVILDFKTVEGLTCLAAENIYFFEYENRRIRIVAKDGEYHLVERIGNIAKRMEPFGFSMPHQSFVVNMLHVKNVRGQQILLDNGMEIPLSQKKLKTWKQELTVYLSQRLEGR